MTRVVCSLVVSPDHDLDDHPENQGRFAHFSRLQRVPFADELVWLNSGPAPIQAVQAVHSSRLLQFLSQACEQARRMGPVEIDPAPTYVTAGSWQAALDAAGGVLAVSRAVFNGPVQRGFALVRPPGHHAGPENSRGFCLLNNMAIAVVDALSGDLPDAPRKVAIVDFDAHHGNGTEAVFWNQPHVGFFSFHQEGIYPGSGTLEEAPHARGRLLNLPLPAHAGDAALEGITGQIIQPWLRRFCPEMLFVSAGFDGHWSDPLTSLGFSTTGYFKLAHSLVTLAGELCGGRVVFVLEGGYDPEALLNNANAVLCALTGQPDSPDPAGPSPYPEPDIHSRITRLCEIHSID